MAATALNLLTAALSQTGNPADALTGTTTAGQTDTAAGLFQTVLASAVSQTTVTAITAQIETATATATTLTTTGIQPQQSGAADELSALLGLLEQATSTDEADDSFDDPTGINTDLLGQLLAALGVNLQPDTAATQPVTGSTTTVSTQVTTVTASVTTVTASVTTATAIASTTQLAAPSATQAPTTAPTSTPLPTAQPTPTAGAVPQTTTVADANQSAGRAPAVVLQTPVAIDPGFRPPTATVPVGTDEVQPPVSELTAVKGTPPVAPRDGTTLTGNPPSEQQLTATSATPTTDTANATRFRAAAPTGDPQPTALPTKTSQPATAAPQPTTATRKSPVAPAVAVRNATDIPSAQAPAPTTPPAGVAAPPLTQTAPPSATSVTNQTPVQKPVANPKVAPVAQPVTTPAAPVRLAAPEVVAPAAQPVTFTVGQLDFTGPTGVNGLFPPGRPSDSDATSGSTATPFGAAPTKAENTPTAIPPTDAPTATSSPSVSAQLADSITAQVRTRPDASETEIRVRLDPPELGSVKLKIVSTGGDVRAELHVSSDAVRRVVESQLPELRQKLDDAGVRVQRFDVTADAGGGNTARDDRGDRWRPPAVDLPPTPAVRPRSATVAPAATGRVDVSV